MEEIIQCSNCGTKNRVPSDRLGDGAKCGRCHAPLPSAKQGQDLSDRILRCSECGKKNRLNMNKLGNHGKCGSCGAELRTQELTEPQPVMISDRNFADKVMKSPLPVLLFAMSPSCPSCTIVAPHVDAFARAHKGKIKVGRVNVQASPGVASRFNILSVPYLLVFDRGQLMESLPGTLDHHQLIGLMSKYLY
jgi:thioredoxin 2